MNTEEKILEALVQMQDEQKLIRADMAEMQDRKSTRLNSSHIH